jgi:penicillin-binding protein 1C
LTVSKGAAVRRWKTRRIAVLLLTGAALTAYAVWRLERPALLAGVSFSQAVYDRDGRLLRLTLAQDEQYRLRRPLARLSTQLVDATLLQEDRWFYWHPGVNPFALVRAAWTTYGTETRRVGGSTITMQLARMQLGLNTRHVGGKVRQILAALEIEARYSKDEILEAYLNRVPYGGNVQGAAAASLAYFGKDPERLTLPEALTLAIVPQHPARRQPGEERAAPETQVDLLAARRRLFGRWIADHPADAKDAAALALPFDAGRTAALPYLAPHFAEAVLADHPRVGELETTLDYRLQQLVERRTHAYIERRCGQGIRNAAVLLLDYRDMAVRAALGSANYYDDAIQGQVNGTRARRSPGSSLKPFIYALGIEQGLIHPLTLLKDAPASFGGFNPENSDREFSGPVKVRDALIRSRNIPAVYVASRLARPTLYQFLQDAGVRELRAEKHYGLALALGGAEVTMEDLAALYAMMINRGALKPLRFLRNEPVVEGRPLLSPESSFLVLDILKDNPRPAQGFRSEWTRDPMPVYWKTGTSYAFRDAWAIGIAGPYVIAVWVGNFDGSSNPAFIGLEAAGPLLFEIVDAIRAQDRALPAAPVSPTAVLARVEVCALSGHIPGPHCRHKVATWFVPGVSPIKTCEVHRAVTMNLRTGQRACALDTAPTRTEVYEFWSSDLLKLFRQAGIPRRTPPTDNPNCPLETRATHGLAPQITSPQAGLTYSLRAGRIGHETVALQAVTDADARAVHWFLDEKYLGESKSGQPFFWIARPGSYLLRAVDDQGRADARDFRVSVVE